MATGRIASLLALTIALALGLAPWRVCAHADNAHARVYVLGLGHAHEHAAAHGHAPADGPGHAHARGHAARHEHVGACGGRHAAAARGRAAHAHRACGPGCRTHGPHDAGRACGRGHGHRHAPLSGPAPVHAVHGPHAADHGHEHPDGHCHCGDHPLVPGLQFTPVALDAHAPGTATTSCLAALASDPGTQEVVPAARPRGWRIACEEDPIVLLR